MTTRNVIEEIDKAIAERRECIPQLLQWLRELAERVEALEQREQARQQQAEREHLQEWGQC